MLQGAIAFFKIGDSMAVKKHVPAKVEQKPKPLTQSYALRQMKDTGYGKKAVGQSLDLYDGPRDSDQGFERF